MNDITMDSRIVNSFLTLLIVVDVITGRWSIFTTLALIGLIGWNGLLFYLTYGPQKPPLTITETINKYPELWGWYFGGDWVGFWELSNKTGDKDE